MHILGGAMSEITAFFQSFATRKFKKMNLNICKDLAKFYDNLEDFFTETMKKIGAETYLV